MSYRLHAAQQVGAVQVSLASHLSTPVEKARDFHRANAVRWQLLLDRMEAIAGNPSFNLHPASFVIDDLRRKVRFTKERARLLESNQLRRLLPALRLLPGYLHFDKGVLSLLRDLTHRPNDVS